MDSNYRTPLIPVRFKVGTHSTSIWLVRKRDIKKLVVGRQIKIFSERYAHPVNVLIEELRYTGVGPLWIVQRW